LLRDSSKRLLNAQAHLLETSKDHYQETFTAHAQRQETSNAQGQLQETFIAQSQLKGLLMLKPHKQETSICLQI